MTHGPVDGDMAELSYDVYDRLVRVVTADGAVTKYFYDAEDVRIGAEHTDADGSTRTETFVTDRQSTYSRLLTVTSDAKTTTYSYGLGLTGVMEGSKTSYYHYNHLGSTTAITDSTGQVITRASYGTYGELLGVTGEAGGETLRFLYNGRYGVQTEENSLYYMRARYYNQDARRFVNLDPVRGELTNTQSLNRYAYVQGNPVRATDPLGLSPEEVEREIDVHLILGLLGCIPFAGAIFSAYDAYLYHKEGNYIMMAGSIVATIGSVCGTGGAAAKYLSKCGIISPKTATIVQKTLMGISLGSGVGYTGYLFGNSISKAIDEKEENGTISSATWKEMIGTAAIHAITTALGVGAAKRMSSPVLKETAKNTTPSTPTTTSATGTIAEVLDDGVGSVGRRKGGLELDLQFFARKKGSKSGTSTSRPTWRQSETDVGDLNPSYEAQKSFLNGKEVPYATRGSSRPDFYTTGLSIEVKNYNVTNSSGRNSLINTVSNQVNKRITDLPSCTKQTIIIDVRGQQVTNDVLRQIRTSILEKCNTDVIIQFMR